MDLLSMALFAGSALLAQVTALARPRAGEIAPVVAEPYRGVPLGVEAAWPDSFPINE